MAPKCLDATLVNNLQKARKKTKIIHNIYIKYANKETLF